MNARHEKMTFEDLEAWKEARKRVNRIYFVTRQEPLKQDFGLIRQIQRAAVSVMSNIAEGFERTSAPEKIQFYNIARSSCGEVRSLLYVIEDNYSGIDALPAEIRSDAIQTGRLISGLIHSTRKRLAGTFLGLLFGIAGLTLLIPYLLP